MSTLKKRTPSEKFTNLLPKVEEKTAMPHRRRGMGDIEVFNIKIDKIQPYEKQARKVFSDNEIQGLSESIKEVGIINPIQIIKGENQGVFHVINGERRLRAARLAGIETIPSIIIDKNSKTELISVIDNIQREDLHPIELAEAISSLIENFGDKKTVSDKLGLPYTSVLENLKLLNLPSEIRDELLNRDISGRAILRKILKQKDVASMRELINEKALGEILNKNKPKKKLFSCSLSDGELYFDINKKNITSEHIKQIISFLTKSNS
jgi:ParB family transcriptional regulator, chromosome partitioning protein